LYNDFDDDRVWSISGRSTTLAYAVRLLQKAERELFLVLSDVDLEALRDEIMAAYNRGVHVSTLLTGEGRLDCGQVAYHPPLESQLQGLTTTLLVVVDSVEVLIASVSVQKETTATITRNADLVLIARQFVWMELFTQRIYARLGGDLLARLDAEDRQIFESLSQKLPTGG
jgi:Cd2+/Zn2+-exporting ATPase